MKGRLLVGLAVALLAGFLLWVFLRIDERHDREDACRDAGGVAVKSHLGPLVCIDRDALIEVGDS